MKEGIFSIVLTPGFPATPKKKNLSKTGTEFMKEL